MGDLVEKRLESLLPDLRLLMRARLLSVEELQSLVKKYRDMEQRILRQDATRRDYMRCVRHELNCELLLKTRFERIGTNQKIRTKVKALSNRRIIHTYNRAVKRFKGDTELWMQYARHCVKSGSSRAAGKVFARALALHPMNEDLWLAAWSWEFEGNANTKTARRLAQRSLRAIPKSRKLWLEYYRLEVVYLSKLRARRKALGIEASDDSEATSGLGFWQGGVVITVLTGALGALGDDVDNCHETKNYFCQYLEVCKQLPLVPTTLTAQVAENLVRRFPEDPSVLEAAALRFFVDGEEWSEKAILDAWTEMRKKALELESETLWQACTTFIQKNSSLSKSLPSVEETLLDARKQGFTISVEDEQFVPGTPELDEKSSPSECREYIRVWLSREGEERPAVEDVSRQLQNRLFSNIRNYNDTIGALWVAFLRSHGTLSEARSAYELMLNSAPGPHEGVVREAIKVEKQTHALKKLRKLYTLRTQACGETDTEVWLDWIQSEKDALEFKAAAGVYWRALRTLADSSQLLQSFSTPPE
ncbi:hypothetical protein NDN08_007807 [Rhodosorus marinus]|uniref:U3 small nucleolar RNA-associated protein 6 homolog n=1 Tax=Rhodosorus marinus TaxID=101924 RepID=A0AAV8UYL7_9RHOD|nr:hypothetical protein NDN08_007807 [Rhodosorus marinus]